MPIEFTQLEHQTSIQKPILYILQKELLILIVVIVDFKCSLFQAPIPKQN